jgi:hypothetical protein
MGAKNENRDIFDGLLHLIVAAMIVFTATYLLGWIRAASDYYMVIQVIFYAVSIIILIETFRRDRYTCAGYLIGIAIGTLFNGITFGLAELLIYLFALLFELYRIRTGPRT